MAKHFQFPRFEIYNNHYQSWRSTFGLKFVGQSDTIIRFQLKHECLDDLIICVTIKHNEDPSKSGGGKKRLTCSGVTLLVNYLSISIKIQLHVWEVMGLRLPCLTAGPFGCSKYSNIIRNVCFDWIRTWYADIWTCRDGNQRVMCCNDLPNDDYSNTHNILQNLGTPTDVWLQIQTQRRLWTIKLRKGPRPHQPTKYLYRLVQVQLKTGENQACYICNECNKCVSPGLVTAWQLSWYLLPAAECRSWPQMLSHYQAIVTASNPRWKCHIKTFNKLFSTFTYL